MRITFVTRKFGNVERNSHCDVLHITPIRVARLFLDCNGDFAIKAYTAASLKFSCHESRSFHGRGGFNRLNRGRASKLKDHEIGRSPYFYETKSGD